MTRGDGRRRIGTVALILAAIAVSGLGLFLFLFTAWTRVHEAGPDEAARILAGAIPDHATGAAYAQIAPDGTVSVRRDLEGPEPARMKRLHVMGWDRRAGRVVTVEFPWWFVRAKLTDRINLGTLLAATGGDWDNIDLPITQDDLARRGPGLVLDHTTRAGARIVIWSE